MKEFACPECDRTFSRPVHLGRHLTATHGHESVPKAEKQRAYREANRDEIAEKQRAYREANRDEIAEKKRAYYEANRDEIAEKKRAYYEANRDEIAEKKRAYYEANRDEIAEKKRAYYEALVSRMPDLMRDAEQHADMVEVERAADAAMSRTTVKLDRPERLLAAREVLRRGGRSGELQCLGWKAQQLQALLRWWDNRIRSVAS